MGFCDLKTFCYIRWSEMCKNHDFSCLCLRKVACGGVRKINLSLVKILQSGQTSWIVFVHYRVGYDKIWYVPR